MREIFRLGLILMTYALIAGAALSLVGLKTMPVIAENLARAEEEARIFVLPAMNGGFESIEGGALSYWIGFRDEAKTVVGGYVFTALGMGYSSEIRTMIGVDENFAIVGTNVLFQQETPGLGTKIIEVSSGDSDPWYMRQFIGKSLPEQLKLSSDGGGIDGISGATISSRAVAESIERGLASLQETVGGNR